MTNKERFLALVSNETSNVAEKNAERIKNRAMLRASRQIALKVLNRLHELSWTQKDLAEALNVSPQQVHKIVKGQENLTLDTLVKLQNILDIAILVDYAEKAPVSKLHPHVIESVPLYSLSPTNYTSTKHMNSKQDLIQPNQSCSNGTS